MKEGEKRNTASQERYPGRAARDPELIGTKKKRVQQRKAEEICS